MAESVDEFFSEWFQSSADEVPNLKNIAILIQSYLVGSATALATSRYIFSELQPQDGSQGPRPSDIVEVFILPIAEDLQDTHENLVELLRALQILSVSPQEGRGQQQTDEQLRTAWQKGLSLRYDLEERGLRYGDPDPDKGWLRDQLRDDWARVNQFAALVYVKGLEDGLWAFGESTLEFALRRKGWRVNWSWPGMWNSFDFFLPLIRSTPYHFPTSTYEINGFLNINYR